MNTCSTCRWWNGETGEYDKPGFEDARFCLREDLKSHGGEDGGIIMPITTQPDFGCNQWEGKDGNA